MAAARSKRIVDPLRGVRQRTARNACCRGRAVGEAEVRPHSEETGKYVERILQFLARVEAED